MPIITVEDGTIVTGANSYVAVSDVAAYASARGLTFDGADSKAIPAVLESGVYLNNESRYIYRGTRRSYLQTMAHPREGLTEYRGPAIPNNVISWRLVQAQCALAVRAYANPGQLQSDLDRGGRIKREKVDVIETEYQDDASPETVISEVQGLLAPLLMLPSSIPAIPYQAVPSTPTAFAEDAFANPPGADPGVGSQA